MLIEQESESLVRATKSFCESEPESFEGVKSRPKCVFHTISMWHLAVMSLITEWCCMMMSRRRMIIEMDEAGVRECECENVKRFSQVPEM